MSFFCRLSRKHYWCTPHRSADNRLIQVCYECGSERPARELHKEVATEHSTPSVAARTDLVGLSAQHSSKFRPWRGTQAEEISGAQHLATKLSLVK